MGAFSGSTIAESVATFLARIPWLAAWSYPVSITLVVLIITYCSLVLGELVPKRLALHNSEKVAEAIAPLMTLMSRAAAPMVSFLSSSTDGLVRLMGIQSSLQPEVTEEDVRIMIDQGTQVGVFEETEQDMVERVFRLGDRRASGLMTPRTDVVYLDLDDPLEDTITKIVEANYSRYPVVQDGLDSIVGIVEVKDLFGQVVHQESLKLNDLLKPALYIPESMAALELVDHFNQTGTEIALVIDEYAD